MDSSSFITEVAERLSPANRPQGFPALLVTLLRELAKGSPVPKDTIAQSLGWPDDRVVAVLEMAPDTEYDDNGNVIGYGISLRKTQHAFEVDGQRLYTWCALDTLMFPAVIGKTARVLSHCPQTGEPILLTVAPRRGATPRAGGCGGFAVDAWNVARHPKLLLLSCALLCVRRGRGDLELTARRARDRERCGSVSPRARDRSAAVGMAGASGQCVMKELAKQLASTFGAGLAAACCLGLTAAVSALTAIGAGFLINDAVLIPLYLALLALSVWLLYRSASAHASLGLFWLGLAGAVVAFAGLWMGSILVYAGLLAIVAGNIADFVKARQRVT